MLRTKINTAGNLVRTKDGALVYSLYVQESHQTHWLDALPNTKNWPGLGLFPERPKYNYRGSGYAAWKPKYDAAMKEWERAAAEYTRALYSDPSYIKAASEFVEKQQRQPEFLPLGILGDFSRGELILVEQDNEENKRRVCRLCLPR
jgi:hypothetical protein